MNGTPHATFVIAEMWEEPVDIAHQLALCIGNDTAHPAGCLDFDNPGDLDVANLPDFANHRSSPSRIGFRNANNIDSGRALASPRALALSARGPTSFGSR